MKIHTIISGLFSLSYKHKVDKSIRDLIDLNNIKRVSIIIIFRDFNESYHVQFLKKNGATIKYILPFFKAICINVSAKSIEHLSSNIDIKRIYLDAKVIQTFKRFDQKENIDALYNIKADTYSGKGITVAYLDSGINRSSNIAKSKNKLLAFKDFVNQKEYPYDDTGHGTLNVETLLVSAHDASIVMAKVIDEFSTAYCSHILAALQWIYELNEKYNIKIIVFPFNTIVNNHKFDLLDYASDLLNNNDFFLCAATGNLGPNEGTITSPGSSRHVFTTGAFTDESGKQLPQIFSARGPIIGEFNKPDAVFPSKISSTLTCSYTAATAAMLLQKNPDLKPSDIKNIIYACCISIKELSTVQGHGTLSPKKLEEWLNTILPTKTILSNSRGL